MGDAPPEQWTLVRLGRAVLGSPDVSRKLALTHLALRLWEGGRLEVGSWEAQGEPGRAREGLEQLPLAPAVPERPQLVPPRAVPKPGPRSPLPLAAHLLHTLAHVELNAVHLAWDTAVRFAPMRPALGDGFFADFLRVAADEARHFGWCQQRLRELGFSYGDMPAHNLLWVDCQKSANHIQDRLAVIPMVQEARGLDAGPRLVERLVGAGDVRTAGIVSRICSEELAHVAVGVAWFHRTCEERGEDPHSKFAAIIQNLSADGVKGPFNHEARALAGLPRHWYDKSQTPSDESLELASQKTDKPRKRSLDTSDVPREKENIPTSAKDFGEIGVANPGSSMEEVQIRLATILSLEEDVKTC